MSLDIQPEAAEQGVSAGTAVATRVSLHIGGMTCAACQSYVQKTLRETPGVAAAEVSLLQNRARVTYSPAMLTIPQLEEVVREAGYEASCETPESMTATEAATPEDSPGSRLIWQAGFALAAGLVTMSLAMPAMGAQQDTDPATRWLESLLMPLVPGWAMWLPPAALGWAQMVLTLAVMLFAAPHIYKRAWAAARHGTTNMNTLVALGTLAAFGASTTAVLAPGLFARHGLAPQVYFEAVPLILGFLLLGNWLEERARRQATSALAGFARMRPRKARVLVNGIETMVPIGQILTGDTAVVLPGEVVPADGRVLSGRSSVDEALLTGESIPAAKSPAAGQDRVIGGTLNLEGRLTLEVEAVGAASVLAQMTRLLEEAQGSRAPMQALADRVSAIFVPVVLAIAVLTFGAWLAASHDIGRALGIAVAVLVVACPCAMGLAVPAAVTVAVGRGAQLGILVKGGAALERLAGITELALDKTGTLTEGRPAVTAAAFAPGSTKTEQAEWLTLAAALERGSEHPLARAVLAYVGESSPMPDLHDLHAEPGLGVVATFGGGQLLIGNAALLAAHKVPRMPEPATAIGTSLHLAVAGRHVLTLVAEDTARPTAAAALAALRSLKITPYLLTGDNAATAAAIAAEVRLPAANVHAHLLPHDKVAFLRERQKTGARIGMVGDGLNDAAALAQADCGLAMASGTELAQQAGDLILGYGAVTVDLTLLPRAVRLARRATRTMRENLGWALIYNLIGLPIAAGVLYPHFHILLSPVLASAAMALSSVSVLTNSLRLRTFR